MKLAKASNLILFLALILFCSPAILEAQTRPIVIMGGTLIDGTGRDPIENVVIVIKGARIESVGKKGELSIPKGSRIIDAKGKTLLPGFIDGHCHLSDFMGELYLHLGVTTCPDITQNDDYWTIAQRDGTDMGKIRGPRIWSTGKRLVGPPPPWARRAEEGYLVKTPEEARKIVREKKEMGFEIIKLNEYVSPEVFKAAADEANRFGLPVTCHCLDVFLAAEAGLAGVEHHWAPGMTSISDPKKRWQIHEDRMSGKIDTAETSFYYEADNFDKIIEVMVEKKISWSPTIATWFRPLSPSFKIFKERELSILNHPRAKYFPPALKMDVQMYQDYETFSPDKRRRVEEGYRKIEDLIRRLVKAGGILRAGSDPNNIIPAIGVHIEMKMFVEAGLTPMQAIQAATINVARTFRKDKDFGTVEPGKVADLVIVEGDPLKEIWATQNVKRVILNGKEVNIDFHPGYKNPIPRNRPTQRTPGTVEISPRSIPQGFGPATLKVTTRGGFEPFHKVTLNGKELETRFVSGRELEATIPSEAIQKPGLYTVVVVNPGDFVSKSSPAYLIIPFKK